MHRREFLYLLGSAATLPRAQPPAAPAFRLTDVTADAGIQFRHNNGAYGGKLLPETLGSGCAFLDYDNDGWPDILLVNGMDWPHRRRARSTLRLYRNNRNGTFTDVTRSAGLDVEMYGMGVAAADFNNDGFVDVFVTCVGQSRLFRNTGKGTFVDVTASSGLGKRNAFSTSAMWLDFDRDGFLDLFVCNYVRWSPEHDVFCSLDGKQKSYCTPEAYRGETSWLFRNRGNGTFEDVTATCGIFDSTSKALGVALIDHDQDGWPDIFVANDTQPNKLYRNNRNGTFREVAVEAGVAFSTDGRARAGMGVDAAVLDDSGQAVIAVTNFDNEMIGLYRPQPSGTYQDVARRTGVGMPSLNRLGFGCVFADLNLDGMLDLVVANGWEHPGCNGIFYQDPSINAALGICVLGHRVIVSSSPHVFVLTDADGDSKADKRELLFTGISGKDHDHGVHAVTRVELHENSLDMGLDGRGLDDERVGLVARQATAHGVDPIVVTAQQRIEHRIPQPLCRGGLIDMVHRHLAAVAGVYAAHFFFLQRPAVKVKPAFSNSAASPGRTASICCFACGAKSMSVISCTPPVMITCRTPSSLPILRNARHTPGGNDTVS